MEWSYKNILHNLPIRESQLDLKISIKNVEFCRQISNYLTFITDYVPLCVYEYMHVCVCEERERKRKGQRRIERERIGKEKEKKR